MMVIDLKPLFRAIDHAQSAEAMRLAVEALAQTRDERAVPKLIEVLGFNNPGAAVAAVAGLIAIGRPAVPVILDNIDGFDYGARTWSNRALAGIGDPRALPNLLDAIAQDFALSVRRAAAKGLGFIHWEWLPEAERPAAQKQVLEALCTAMTDEEWVVRYATVMGLEELARQAPQHQGAIAQCWAEQIQNETEIAVRARIFRAQTRI